jgi:hypothetical protein
MFHSVLQPDIYGYIFFDYRNKMATKSHKIIIRITESQAKWLADVLIQEQRTKSQVLREALNQYLIETTHRHEITKDNNKQLKTDE